MTYPLIYDGLIVLVMLWCIVRGYRRGFILTVSSVVVLILACLGASFASDVLSPSVSTLVSPHIETSIYAYLEESIDNDVSLEQALEGTELEAFLPLLQEEILSDLGQKAEDITSATVETIAYLITDVVVGFAVWIVAFILLLIVLSIAMQTLNLVAKLPLLQTINALGGAVAGAVWGLLVVHVLLMLLGFLGYLPTDAQVAQTYVYSLFVDKTPQAVTTLVSIV